MTTNLQVPDFVPTICRVCGREFKVLARPGVVIDPRPCSECVREANAQQEFETRAGALRAAFEQMIEPKYAETDLEHATMVRNMAAINKVLAWRPYSDGKGFLLCGGSGSGKTRTAWLLIRRLMCEYAIRVVAIREVEFIEEYRKRWKDRTEAEFADNMKRCPVLFLDDVGVSSPSATYKEHLYNLVETRTANKRPIIATSNLRSSEIEERMGVKDGARIITRLRDACEMVQFV